MNARRFERKWILTSLLTELLKPTLLFEASCRVIITSCRWNLAFLRVIRNLHIAGTQEIFLFF